MNSATISILIVVVGALFIWGKFPNGWVALAGAMMCAMLGYIDKPAAFSGLASTNPVLLASMMVVGGACFHSGLARRLAEFFLKICGRTERGIILALMLVTGLFSVICNNTGTLVTFIPIMMSICAEAKVSPSKVILPVAFATCLGGNVTLISTGTFSAVSGVLEELGYEGFGFWDPAYVGIPLFLVSMLFFVTVGLKFVPDRPIEEFDFSDITEAKENKNQMILTGVVIIAVVVVMMFTPKNLPLYMISSIGAVILVFTGCISEKQAYQAISWPTVFLCGGMTAVSSALSKTGGAQMIADFCKNLIGENPSKYVVIAVLFIGTSLLTNVMSNVACATMMTPIVASLSEGIGIDPVAMVMVTTIAANAAYLLPIGTPPFVIAADLGKYKFSDFIKCGLPVTIFNLILVVILTPIVYHL